MLNGTLPEVQPHLFPLHNAILRDDQPLLKTLLATSTPSEPCPQLRVLCRGQTPLTLAITLGRHACTRILLDAGASVLLKNAEGWSPFQEATSYGNRDIMRMLFRMRYEELGKWFAAKGREVIEALAQDVKDFYMEIHWSFRSIIPFLGSLCPSDTYRVYKKGTAIRIDSTLVGFEGLSWIRGDISIIFKDDSEGPRLVICDRQRRLVQQLWPWEKDLDDQEVHEEVSVALNTKIIGLPMIDFSTFSVSRAQTGWIWSGDRDECIGPWHTTVWSIDTLEISIQTRCEHLEANPPPTTMNTIKIHSTKGSRKRSHHHSSHHEGSDSETEDEKVRRYEAGLNGEDDKDMERAQHHIKQMVQYRPSLDLPPAAKQWTLESFFDEDRLNEYLHLGRPLNVHKRKRKFSGYLWMYQPPTNGNGEESNGSQTSSVESETEDSTNGNTTTPTLPKITLDDDDRPTFVHHHHSLLDIITTATTAPFISHPTTTTPTPFPLSIHTLLPLLDLLGVGSNEHIKTLQEFMKAKLPPGMPVQVEVPVGMLPLSAVLRFGEVVECEIDERVFDVPGRAEGYVVGEVLKGELV
ncbi:hypothetical protein HDV00_002410 [Rhizophlyctis rosea]|nr:hypothetical protein HDV00_002410 [Rhizophlyctis rosea]